MDFQVSSVINFVILTIKSVGASATSNIEPSVRHIQYNRNRSVEGDSVLVEDTIGFSCWLPSKLQIGDGYAADVGFPCRVGSLKNYCLRRRGVST